MFPAFLYSLSAWFKQLYDFGGEIWFTASEGAAYHVTNTGAVRISPAGFRANEIVQAGGKLWLLGVGSDYAGDPAYVGTPSGEGFEPFPSAEGMVKRVLEHGRHVWFATGDGAYRMSGSSIERVPDRRLAVRNLQVVDGAVWVTTADRAYRIEGESALAFVPVVPDVTLDAVLSIDGRLGGATSKVEGMLKIAGPMVELRRER